MGLLYHLFSGGFLSPSLSVSLYYDVNEMGRLKAVTSIPILLGLLTQLLDRLNSKYKGGVRFPMSNLYRRP